MLSSVERHEFPNHMKQLEDVQDFTCKLECWFCHESWIWDFENERNNKWNDKSHFLFDIVSEEMLIEEYVQLVQHGWIGGFGMGYKNPFGFKCEWRANGGNDVDDKSTPIVKLPQAHEYAQLLSNLSILWSF